MTVKEQASAIVSALDAKLAEDINVLRIEKVTTLADYFVLCTGNSSTHVNTLKDAVEMKLEGLSVRPHHIEGHGGIWVLMDYGSVVVHIFTDEGRRFYQLDKMWADAEAIPVEEMLDD